jgi:hypothetical protein
LNATSSACATRRWCAALRGVGARAFECIGGGCVQLCMGMIRWRACAWVHTSNAHTPECPDERALLCCEGGHGRRDRAQQVRDTNVVEVQHHLALLAAAGGTRRRCVRAQRGCLSTSPPFYSNESMQVHESVSQHQPAHTRAHTRQHVCACACAHTHTHTHARTPLPHPRAHLVAHDAAQRAREQQHVQQRLHCGVWVCGWWRRRRRWWRRRQQRCRTAAWRVGQTKRPTAVQHTRLV